MARKKRKNRQIAKAKEAFKNAALKEFMKSLDKTPEEIFDEKYGIEKSQGATNTLGDLLSEYTIEQLKQIP